MTKSIVLTKAKNKLEKIVNDVVKSRAKYIITNKQGEPQAAVVGIEELESLIETLDLLTNPKAVKALKRAEKDVKLSRLFSHEEVFGRKL
jgi:prevent-host-death family protein